MKPYRYKIIVLLILCITCGAALSAQERKFSGAVQMAEGRDSKTYFISVTQNGQDLTGFSITDIDGAKLKATVIGRLTEKELYLRETNSTDAPIAIFKTEICLFISTLHPANIAGKSGWKGTFDGYTNFGKPCGTGSIFLVEDKAVLTVKKRSASPVIVAKKDAFSGKVIPQKPLLVNVPVIKPSIVDTNKFRPLYYWNNDTLSLDIYDGFTVDGDVVGADFDGQTILKKTSLTADKIHFNLPLLNDIDSLTLLLYDEGFERPNTPNIILQDGTQKRTILISGNYGDTAKLYFIRRKR